MYPTPSSEYKETVSQIEALWVKHDADVTCRECIAGPRGGCCQGCTNLELKGCVEKPIPCALWSCMDVRSKHPQLVIELSAIYRVAGELGRGFRTGAFFTPQDIGAVETKQLLVQIQGAAYAEGKT